MKSSHLAILLSALLSITRADAADPSLSLPAAHIEAAKQAKQSFERGNFREAEKIYESILAAAPDNLYVLSNLGVVRFRAGKLKLAEEAFRRAITVAPTDAFSHCTLGIVYYSQGKLDEAVNSLTRALAIEPKNQTAHEYLGIATGQKLDPAHARPETGVGDFFTPLEKSRLQIPPSARQ